MVLVLLNVSIYIEHRSCARNSIVNIWNDCLIYTSYKYY